MRHRIEIRTNPQERALLAELEARLTARYRQHDPTADATIAKVIRHGIHLAAVDLGIEVPSAWRPECTTTE